nr:GntR family transcriptional regulator [uncultured Dorea sp.]
MEEKSAQIEEIEEGELLPTVRQMAADLGINNMTVSKAYQLLKSVKLLKNGLPKEHFSKTNGSADEKQLLGKFNGAESGKCRMYVWLEQSEVIQIKTKKYTVFMNNKDKDQTTVWYEQLKKAEP